MSPVAIVSKSYDFCVEMVVFDGRSLPTKRGNPGRSWEFLGGEEGRFTHEGGRRSWRGGTREKVLEVRLVGILP